MANSLPSLVRSKIASRRLPFGPHFRFAPRAEFSQQVGDDFPTRGSLPWRLILPFMSKDAPRVNQFNLGG